VRVAVAAVFLLTLGGVAFEITAGGSGRNSPRAASVGTGREVFTGDFETGGTVRSLSLPALGNVGSITYGRFLNEPLVLNFFASWCPFCIHEMPAFQNVYASLGGRVAFLGISQRDEPSASLDLVTQTGVTYPAAIDEGGRFFDAIGSGGMPTTLFIKPGGRIVHIQVGPLDESSLRQYIQRYFGLTG
jgi:thiol-disulfide isomerase/thioredoxin